MICKKCGAKMEMQKDRVYTSLPPMYGFVCPKCGAMEFSHTPEWDDAEQSAINHAAVEAGVPSDIDPADVYLTRAWLLKHGWEPTNNYPLFQGSPDCIDCDLCVVVDRKDYMIAKFHYMGDDAWKPNAMPDSFELVGVNNSADLLEYDHTRLVMAAFVCHLTGFEQIEKAIGGEYEMTMIKKMNTI